MKTVKIASRVEGVKKKRPLFFVKIIMSWKVKYHRIPDKEGSFRNSERQLLLLLGLTLSKTNTNFTDIQTLMEEENYCIWFLKKDDEQ